MTDLVSIGVDMGGTKIEVAVLKRPGGAPLGSGKFDVLARNRVPTDRDRGYDAVLETMAGVIRKTAGDAAVDEREVPVGVGMPGSITRREGLVKNSNTVCLNGDRYARVVLLRRRKKRRRAPVVDIGATGATTSAPVRYAMCRPPAFGSICASSAAGSTALGVAPCS
jgi:fructokinase